MLTYIIGVEVGGPHVPGVEVEGPQVAGVGVGGPHVAGVEVRGPQVQVPEVVMNSSLVVWLETESLVWLNFKMFFLSFFLCLVWIFFEKKLGSLFYLAYDAKCVGSR